MTSMTTLHWCLAAPGPDFGRGCSKIITDNQAFVRTVLKAGRRTNFVTTELEDILPEEIEEEAKEAAEISMGTEVCWLPGGFMAEG